MLFINKISARQLSVTSLAIWIFSLALTGLVVYSGQKHILGITIFATGWLSPLVLNFAWFANIFFLYGIFNLLSGRVPTKSAIFAALLSLDTLRFSQILLDEGGGKSPIYGYGWGVVLWFVAISIMVLATGKRQREIHELNDRRNFNEWLQPLGFALFLITLGVASFFAIHDRSIANPSESKRLSGIAFKRGLVCSTPEPVAINPIKALSGPVEVVIANNASSLVTYPFAKVENYLEWGIPTIRVGSNDYSYDSHNGLLLSVPATGTPAAILFVSDVFPTTISAKLVEGKTNRTVFNQSWELEKSSRYCPDFENFPDFNEQPRQLLMQALNVRTTKTSNKNTNNKTESFEGKIISKKDGGITLANRIAQWNKINSGSTDSFLAHERYNTNCPAGVGWGSHENEPRLDVGPPFKINDKSYYLRYGRSFSATCEGGFAYIYSGTLQSGSYRLQIEKRDLQNFRQVWAGLVVIASGISSSTRDDALKIQSVTRSTDEVTIELVDENSGEVFFVQAPIHGK